MNIWQRQPGAARGGQGRPIDLFVTEGQVSDYIVVRVFLGSLPKVDWLLGDRDYDTDWFGEALQDKWIRDCIPARKQRKTTVRYDKRRNCTVIIFGRLKDWRRGNTLQLPKARLSAVACAATVIYRL